MIRRSWLPLTISAVVIAGVLVGAIYYQTGHEEPAGAGAPVTAAPSPLPSTSASPSPDASPSPLHASNPQPDLTVDPGTGLSKATATIVMNSGVIRFKFYAGDAPNSVKRMLELIGQGFYNGLTFHRAEPNFIVQGGDPTGNGLGGSGQKLKAEFNNRRHVEGTIGLAHGRDPDSADSQFYITLSPQPHLDGKQTVIGQVIEGMEVARRIQRGDRITQIFIE